MYCVKVKERYAVRPLACMEGEQRGYMRMECLRPTSSAYGNEPRQAQQQGILVDPNELLRILSLADSSSPLS